MIFSSSGMLQEILVEPSPAMLKEVRMHHASIVYSD